MVNILQKILHGLIKTFFLWGMLGILVVKLPKKTLLALLTLLAIFLVIRKYSNWFYVLVNIFKWVVRIIVKVLYNSDIFETQQSKTFAKIFFELVEKQPNKIVFRTEARSWTYLELADLSLRSAYMLKKEGIKRGDVVGLMFDDGGGAELPALWIGLATIGAIGALLPPQLRGDALIRSVKISEISNLIYSHPLTKDINDIKASSDLKNVIFYQFNVNDVDVPLLDGAKCANSMLKDMPTKLFNEELALGKFNDNLIYIYPIGTTGLSNAAKKYSVDFFYFA